MDALPDRPSVSVVIPVFNAEPFLADAIDSILTQHYSPLEIVVVDDGSTDASAAVAARYPVTLVRQATAGIGAARNAGVSAAAGILLAFLDADDLWLPGKLARQVDALQSDPSLDIVLGHVEHFVSPGTTAAHEAPPAGPAYLAGAMLVRRDSFDRVGPFVTDLRVGEFVDWYARAKEAGLKTLVLPDLVLRRRLHDTNTGIRERDSRVDYARVLRAALDRRRTGAAREQ